VTVGWSVRAALFVLAAWALLGIAAPALPLSPNAVDLPLILAPPGAEAWLGRDELGRPVADRLLLGAGTSLQVALSVVAVSGLVGTLLGALAAYRGGWLDRLLTAAVDVFMAFPGLLLAIALAGVLGPGLDNLVVALSVVGWVGYARLARAQTLSLRRREHVQAALALGAGTARVVRRHLLPLMAGPLVVEATFGLAAAVVAEAGLSFLGIGIQPPGASWGTMIREGVRYMLVAPHLVLAPGLALSLVVLAVNLAGDWLRDRLDVRSGAATARRTT
jgi:peptide/nickel transport system permease protein